MLFEVLGLAPIMTIDGNFWIALFLIGFLALILIKWAVEYGDREDRRRVERKFEKRLDERGAP